ncbi:hypothetical protein NLG97_g3379 [Lecanicillium saksenae]|uniref:Uncharacterized protein n=1 Tax=Lecanicillium saksenae TaxID=468837 RepID=A0ACC1QYV6_9HYPO|nr:hypothetical protein NLG97_g3379 [Lecanicillium saksenae]
MKFSIITTLFLAGASATAIPSPNLSVVLGVMNSVQNAIDALDQAGRSFKGDLEPLADASTKLISTITDGVGKIQAITSFTAHDAVGLIHPTKALTQHAQVLAQDFLAARSEVEKAGACEVVQAQIGAINDASNSLNDAIVSKVPAGLQGIARGLAGGLTSVLDQSKASFGPGQCNNAA